MSKDEAMTKYIAIIDNLAKTHGVGGAESSDEGSAAPVSTSDDLLVEVSYVLLRFVMAYMGILPRPYVCAVCSLSLVYLFHCYVTARVAC